MSYHWNEQDDNSDSPYPPKTFRRYLATAGLIVSGVLLGCTILVKCNQNKDCTTKTGQANAAQVKCRSQNAEF